MHDHLIRIGVLADIGRFRSSEGLRFGRGTTVICRTRRGLELGTVLKAVEQASADSDSWGTIVRAATPEDHLLWARIQKHRKSAFENCQRLLNDRAVGVPLLDVELLFDGTSMYFYFLGETTPDIEALTTELADTYEARSQLRQFRDALAAGCGPDCGSGEGGCGESGGSAGCGSCSIASACAKPAP